MKHLDLLKANKIANTSTAVYGWINKMPASAEESKWLKKTFDGLYQLEQNFVLDTATNDDKETTEVWQRAEATSKEWVDQIIAIHDREEPKEEEEEISIPKEEPLELPQQEIKVAEPIKEAPISLSSKLENYLGDASSKKISKRKLLELGYQGKYPSATSSLFIEDQFKLKREKRTSSLHFLLSKKQ